MIDKETQLILVRKAYLKIIDILYTKQFRAELTVSYSCNEKWYKSHLHRIDVISVTIEHAIMENNPRRAMRYICLLNYSVNQLIEKVNSDYKPFFNQTETKM